MFPPCSFEPPWCAAMGRAAGGAPWVMCGAPRPLSSSSYLLCSAVLCSAPRPPLLSASTEPLLPCLLRCEPITHNVSITPQSLGRPPPRRGFDCKLSTRILIIPHTLGSRGEKLENQFSTTWNFGSAQLVCFWRRHEGSVNSRSIV